MRDVYQEQLWNLNQELIQMGAACEEIIDLASKALTDYSQALEEETAHVGATIDESERTIETICLKLLLRQQPVAGDLRQISAAMKMITDMERIGDQADDIAELIPHLPAALPGGELLRAMARETIAMVNDSVTAYVRQDVALAERVMAADDTVDDYFGRVKRSLIASIAHGGGDGEGALDILMVAKYFERIGDHATNIAEWVEFSVTGVHKEETT